MRKRWNFVSFAISVLIVIISALATSSGVYAASPSSVVASIHNSSLRLSSVAGQSAHTVNPSTLYTGSKKALKPQDTPTCFNVSINVQKTYAGTNTFALHGLVTLTCSRMYGGGLSIVGTILCSGFGAVRETTYASFGSGVYTQGNTFTYLYNGYGICENCNNHVPYAWPFFTITNYAVANSYEPAAGQDLNNPASWSIPIDGSSNYTNTGFSNSSNYTIPC